MKHVDPKTIEMLVMDVDGVLTDGSIFLNDDGVEFKRFNVRDGLGLRVWQNAGLKSAIITGRTGRVVQHRAAELRIGEVVQGSGDKWASLEPMLRRLGVPPERVAYVGDDLPDLSAMSRVGYPIAVGDADERVVRCAAHVTRAAGGRGAVREAIEHILSAKGVWAEAVARYQRRHHQTGEPLGG